MKAVEELRKASLSMRALGWKPPSSRCFIKAILELADQQAEILLRLEAIEAWQKAADDAATHALRRSGR